MSNMSLTVKAILQAAGNQWSNVSINDLCGMITGAPYEKEAKPPCTRLLVGISQEDQLNATRELLKRDERELHIEKIIRFGGESPYTRHHCTEAIATTWPTLNTNVSTLFTSLLSTAGNGVKQLICSILVNVKILESTRKGIEDALETLTTAHAHETRRLAHAALGRELPVTAATTEKSYDSPRPAKSLTFALTGETI